VKVQNIFTKWPSSLTTFDGAAWLSCCSTETWVRLSMR